MIQINLKTPCTRPMYYDVAILDRIIWVPKDKQVIVRVTLGYYQDNGVWRETSDKQYVIENLEGVPAYDQIIDAINTVNLKDTPIEMLITQAHNKGDLEGVIAEMGPPII